MLKLLGTILLLAASTLSFNLSAEIYTWTDKYGKVHFSDKPIDGEKVTTVTPKENHNIADVVSKDSQWQQDYNKTKQAKAERAQKEATLAKKNKGYCKQLKSQLAIINQGGRIYMMSPDGQRSFKSEAQLTAQKKKLNKTIKKTCR